MKIFGINFNAAPSEKKLLTIAICDFKKIRILTTSKTESLLPPRYQRAVN
jgi:hypothetical protein